MTPLEALLIVGFFFLVILLSGHPLAFTLGGMAVLGAVVAPSTFQVLQARDPVAGRVLAGAVFGTALDRFQFVAYACAAVVLVTLGLMARVKTRGNGLAVRAAIAAALLAHKIVDVIDGIRQIIPF